MLKISVVWLLLALLVFIPIPEISATPKSLKNLTKPRDVDMDANECVPGHVLELKARDFDESIRHGFFYIKFYLPDCPACQAVAQTWIKVAEALKKKHNICVAELSCKDESDGAAELCKELEVTKVPVFFWYENGASIKKFEGETTFENLYKFAREMNRFNDSSSFAEPQIFNSNSIYFNLFGSIILYSYFG
ncbi:hypothetical protein KR074_000043 [Drosophila pseudoananassae]|nr:hypothetical protein KR074_000043 [Drosophila pseudoananassae]